MDILLNKTFTISVGIEYPYIDDLDDEFEIELHLTTDEINSIVENGKKQIWIDNELETWEYLEAFAKSAYYRASKLAEEYAIKKWGSQMSIEQGAKFIFFLPDEISDAIFESEDCKLFKKKALEIETISKERFHADTRILYDYKEKSDWGKLIINDKHWNNEPFGGLWSHGLGKLNSEYGIHTNFKYDSQTIEISYSQNYQLDSKTLELRLYRTNDNLEKIIKQRVVANGYNILEISPIGQPKYSWVLYAEGKKDESDINVFIDILNQIAKLK